MPKTKRVGCILSCDEKEVKFLGYGNYVGDEIPHKKVGGLGSMLIEIEKPNPKILLDNGKDVFGCECWWGDEVKVKSILKNRKVIYVDIDEVRKESNA